jgi:hypothetical protein
MMWDTEHIKKTPKKKKIIKEEEEWEDLKPSAPPAQIFIKFGDILMDTLKGMFIIILHKLSY